MARNDESDVPLMTRMGRGGTALSALLHLTVIIVLLKGVTPPRRLDQPPPLAVEIVLEAPPPAPTLPETRPTAATPPPPPAIRPAAAHPVIHSAAPHPSPAKAAPASPPAVTENTAPPPQAPEPMVAPAAPPPPMRTAGPAEVGAYVGRLRDSIIRHRIYPPQSMRRHEEGDVQLRILLATDGRLLDILNLAEASASLTQAARHAVESAAPFEPPPPGTASDRQIAFDVTVAFRLR